MPVIVKVLLKTIEVREVEFADVVEVEVPKHFHSVAARICRLIQKCYLCQQFETSHNNISNSLIKMTMRQIEEIN